ncbi:MAG: hypothetical protein HY661_13825 [Betaproteobacteria bacterium]|nr:hypothetical protein [Betaproteobacteria bacterium]
MQRTGGNYSDTYRARMTAAGMAGLLALGYWSGAAAHSDHTTGLSGRELFPGTKDGEVTKNVLFAGKANAVCNCWTDTDNGGTWVAIADRVGHAGLGSAVTLAGGRWYWEQQNDVIHHGRILGGSVEWPADLAADIGCGSGVARFLVTLSVSGRATGGTLTGCLDDTHIPFVFPPTIWGTLTL